MYYKHFYTTLLISVVAFLTTQKLSAQTDIMEDSTGLPGDHFSLQGAIELFKKAQSMDDFEKLLNTEDNAVNNLDLNQDGEIDYIRVIDNSKDKTHAIVLQAVISEKEEQDIAVIELEENGKSSVVLQIVGDEDIYGEEKIVEPYEESANDDKEKDHGPALSTSEETFRIVVNVYPWPLVRFIYAPAYVPYVSPWRWHAYPVWWRPWRPHPLYRIYPFRAHYFTGVHVCTVRRVPRAHVVYAPHRRTSVTVTRTHSKSITTYRNNRKVEVNRTTKKVEHTGPRGNHVETKRTKTTVEGPRGNKVQKTKTTRTTRRK